MEAVEQKDPLADIGEPIAVDESLEGVAEKGAGSAVPNGNPKEESSPGELLGSVSLTNLGVMKILEESFEVSKDAVGKSEMEEAGGESNTKKEEMEEEAFSPGFGLPEAAESLREEESKGEEEEEEEEATFVDVLESSSSSLDDEAGKDALVENTPNKGFSGGLAEEENWQVSPVVNRDFEKRDEVPSVEPAEKAIAEDNSEGKAEQATKDSEEETCKEEVMKGIEEQVVAREIESPSVIVSEVSFDGDESILGEALRTDAEDGPGRSASNSPVKSSEGDNYGQVASEEVGDGDANDGNDGDDFAVSRSVMGSAEAVEGSTNIKEMELKSEEGIMKLQSVEAEEREKPSLDELPLKVGVESLESTASSKRMEDLVEVASDGNETGREGKIGEEGGGGGGEEVDAEIERRRSTSVDIGRGDGEGFTAVTSQDDDDEEDDEEEEDDEVSETDTRSFGGGGVGMGGGLSLPARPAGLGRSMASLEPVPRVAAAARPSTATSQPSSSSEDAQLNPSEGSDGNDETKEKLQMIRVKFLRLAHRLGQTAHNVVVAQVLYRLGLAEQLRGGRSTNRSGSGGAYSFERANSIAEEQEAAGHDDLDFTCTIMVLGKSGVGKSATINSIFDEVKSETDAFTSATTKVREIRGTVHGIKLRVIDTPGLQPSFSDQRNNERTMRSVKRFIKKSPPDIVLYYDRLDVQSRDYGDLPLLRTITDTFGAAIWFNAIVVLTHASSAPPDGANGIPLSYEMFVAQRSHIVQQTIRQAAGDLRLMNPVSLVENHPACRTNRAGQRVLPNGQVWKPQLLLLCFASKILAEANSLLKLQDSNSPARPFGARPRVPPLPYLLSSLLQSRAPLKLPDEQMGDDDDSDEDFEEESDSDDEAQYDDLPPFRRLTKDELSLLDRDQKRAYFEELDYREKLYQKKQWKEELERRKEMKKRSSASSKQDSQQAPEEMEEEGRSASVPVPMPDMVLPPSFDSDNPSHRYRYLETGSQWLVRPVLETHGWDHDSGYEGLNMEKMFVFLNKIPASVSGQVTKDKKEANVQLECAASLKHGEGKVTLTGLDVQTIGKDLAYTVRTETRFSNFRHNKTTGGLAVTFLGDTVATGLKIEDKLIVGRRLKVVLNSGAITGRGDTAYGGSLEVTLRDKDYPIGRTITTLGLSVMDWHKDLAIGGNLQSQFMLGKTSMTARANLNNRGAGQISIRSSSSEQLQMVLIGIIPIVRTLLNHSFLSSSQRA